MPSIRASVPASTALRPCPSGWPSGQASMPRERLPKALQHRGPSFPGKSARDVALPQGATSPPGSTQAIQALAWLSRSPAAWPCSSPPRLKKPPRPRRRLPPPPGSRSKPSTRPRSAPRPGAGPPPPCRSSSMTSRPTRAGRPRRAPAGVRPGNRVPGGLFRRRRSRQRLHRMPRRSVGRRPAPRSPVGDTTRAGRRMAP